MARYFTHYWRNATFNLYRDNGDEGKPLDFIVSNQFRLRNIAPGDYVYVISVFHGQLFLVGKLMVNLVCKPVEAALILSKHIEDLYSGDDVIIAKSATGQHFNVSVDLTVTKKLRFVNPANELRMPVYVSEDCLDNQTLRGVRELSPASAHLLDQFLPPLEELSSRSEIRDSSLLPDQVCLSNVVTYREGRMTTILVNAYERDSKAREACIAHFGYECAVCGFSMAELYGLPGYGYVHVHHLKPLAEIGDDYEVDPVTDLRPVCPNCHAMLHRTSPPLTIEQLKEHTVLKKTTETQEYNEYTVADSHYVDFEVYAFEVTVWDYAVKNYIEPARLKGLATVKIRSSQIHGDMKLHDKIRQVCRAFDSIHHMSENGVALKFRTGRPLGANAEWEFSIL
jgi:5-methylcytosine-specific restriction endonuclease McrA